MKIIPAQAATKHELLEKLARMIIPEFGEPIHLFNRSTFYLDKFQLVNVIQDQLAEGFDYYLLVNSRGKEVGYMGLKADGVKLQLSMLYILKAFRGKKLGQQAMELVFDKARQYGLNEIELMVNRQNVKTIAFCQQCGFSIVEDPVQHFDNNYTLDDYRMFKALDKVGANS